MGKIVKIFIVILIICLIIIFGYFSFNNRYLKYWKYDLSNNYQIRKNKDMMVYVGYVKDNKFYINYEGKKVGVDEYIAEFQTSTNYVGLRCVREKTLEVIYYIIDTKNKDVYGPYNDLDTYLEVLVKITDGEVFDKFKSTSDFDK